MHEPDCTRGITDLPAGEFSCRSTPAPLTIDQIAQHLASDRFFYCGNFGPMNSDDPAIDSTTADSVKAMWPQDSLVRGRCG